MPEKLISELIILPDRVRKGDFVLNLSKGVTEPEKTLEQWHPEIDPEFGETAGQSFQTMLEQDAHELGLTLEEIRAWEPPQKAGLQTRKARTKKG